MYDAIIIGARCAGAPTAMQLARRGHKVLLVDKARFPSDTLSTHIVWPHGAAVLKRWGLLERLAATGCPPIALNMTFDVGPFALIGGVTDANDGHGGYCPRRTVLDNLLVDAAVESGAELREEFTVDDLVWAGERVVGIKGRSRNGNTVEERGRIVIGADGAHSMVARTVRAPEYDAIPPLAASYYSYYSGFRAEDIEQYIRDEHGVGCFPTHDDLTLIVVVWPSARFPEVRADIDGHVKMAQQSAPSVVDRLRGATRETRWVGTAGVANYFRTPFGPGWALVGDAGHEKDPITAQGISDAFVDAENLATAIDDGFCGRRPLHEALELHQSNRDRRVKPMYDFTCRLARLGPPPPQLQALFGALRGNRAGTDRFFSALTGSSPLEAFMNPDNIDLIVGAARSGA